MISPHNTNVYISFYNDRVKEIVAPDEMAELFTFVPIKAAEMDLVQGNTVVFGGITEGYDVITPLIETELTFRDISGENARIDLLLAPLLIYQIQHGNSVPYLLDYEDNDINDGNRLPTPYDKCTRQLKAALVVYIPFNIYEGSTYYVTINNYVTGINETASYTALPGDTHVEVKAGLEASMTIQGFEPGEGGYGVLPYQIFIYPRTQRFDQVPYQAGDINTIYKDFQIGQESFAYALTVGNTIKRPNLKCGAVHGFGIVYKDLANRLCSVMKTPEMNVKIPFYAEDPANLITSVAEIVFKIHHKPPSWADTYEIVYYGNISMDWFMQMRADNIVNIEGNRFAINFNDAIAWTREQNARWKVPDYIFAEGDRIRLVGIIDEAAPLVITPYTVLYDYEIEQVGYGEVEEGYEDWILCQALSRPAVFGNNTSIENASLTLDGTVANTTPNGVDPAVARVDTVTLTGVGGTALITCGGLQELATFNGTLGQTALDFKATHEAAYAAIGIDVTVDAVKILFTALVAGVDFPGARNIIMEVYRPQKGLSITTPYGSGMVFGIGTDENGQKYHKGDVDQIVDAGGQNILSAEVDNIAYDCYKFVRLNYKYNQTAVFPFYAESLWPSDWWYWQVANKLTSQGFPFLDDLNQRQTTLVERLRHGGKLISGTRTNDIARFVSDPDNITWVDLSRADGKITGIREVGFVLKVLQEYKETSIYINRIQTFNADGSENLIITNKFLGTVYPLITSYGCQHPDSIMVNNRYMYYWDNSEGVFIRSAPNGQVVLDKKVKRWYKDLLAWIRANGGANDLRVITGANNDYDEVWVSFQIGDVATGMIFSERDGQYKSRINLKTENYIHLGNFFAHLYRQRIWIINIDEGQDFLSWNGVDNYAIMELVSNINPEKVKVFNAVALYSDHQWESEPKTVVIPAEASGSGDVMESNISIWDQREGVYYGKILKDENSPGNYVSINDRKMNGREMRGRYCFIELMTEEHGEKVRLDSMIIFSTDSERSA